MAPQSPDLLGQRSFFNSAWLAPVGLVCLAQLLQRFDNFGLGYVMFRITSDVEKLPFPMAPVGAMGVTALADASSGQETWRWRVFSFGAMLGLFFGAIYAAMPAVTQAFVGEAIGIFPIPFKDLTGNIEDFLPAVPFMLSFNLGLLLTGMVLPYWAMVGSFIGLLACVILNQALYHGGILRTWSPGIGAISTINSNYLDFYFSFGLGLTAAIAVIGFYHVFQSLTGAKKALDEHAPARTNWKLLLQPPAGRGDFSIWAAIGVYVAVTAVTITAAWWLLGAAHRDNPANSAVTLPLLGVFVFYGFIYTPIISYVSARMEGIVGMSVNIPFIREATFILSGYQGAAIWFAPFPIHNYGAQTLYFRKTELTGTKMTSMLKAELFVFPVVLVSLLVFSQFIWNIAPVPSAAFPYAEKMWEAMAYRQGLLMTSTLPGNEGGVFSQAFVPWYLFAGLGIALALYAGMSSLGLPVLMVYGLIRGLDMSQPDVILPQFAGALLGRYYFTKTFGDRWPQYRVVFFAGYTCGVGLVMMLSLGLVFMSKAVFQSQY